MLALLWKHLAGKAEALISYCGDLSAETATRENHIHILEFLSRSSLWTGDNSPSHLGRIAVVYNQIEALRWLPTHGQSWDDVALTAAAHGTVEVMNILLEEGNAPEMNTDFVTCCVQYGRVDALQWCYDTLRTRVPDLWTEDNLKDWLLLAGTYDKTDVVKFLLQHGALWPDIGGRFGEYATCFEESGGSGFHYEESSVRCLWSPSFLEWALSEGCTFDTWTTATCARLMERADWDCMSDCPFLKTLACAHTRGCPCACPRAVPDF